MPTLSRHQKRTLCICAIILFLAIGLRVRADISAPHPTLLAQFCNTFNK